MAPRTRSSARFTLIVSVLVGLLLPVLRATDIDAQAPDSVSFQGMLTDTGGSPLDTTVSMTFKLYKGVTAVWTETQPSVVVTDGIFSVLLGSVTPLDTVAFNQPIEIGIKVGADPEISPKPPLSAAPYALARKKGMCARRSASATGVMILPLRWTSSRAASGRSWSRRRSA